MRRLVIMHVLEAAAGGSGLQVRRLAAAQAAAGHRVLVVLSNRRKDADFGDQVEALRASGCEVNLLPMSRLPGIADLLACWRLRRWYRASGAEVVHTHCAKAGFVGRLAGIGTSKVNGFHTPHSWYLHGLRGAKLALAKRLERFLASRSAGLICVSEEEAGEAVNWGICCASAIAVVPNGLPDDYPASLLERAEARERLGIPADVRVIGAFARLTKRKRLARLLQMLTHLPNDVAAVFVGGGEDELELRARAVGLGVGERSYFCGYWPGAGRMVRALDVAVLPSEWEGRSLFALEALAGGVPLVVADAPGNRFAAAMGADLVAGDDAAHWAMVVEQALAKRTAMAAVPTITEQAKMINGVYLAGIDAVSADVDNELRYGTTNRQARMSGS